MSPSRIFSLVVSVIVALVLLGIVGGSFYTVDEGERAVVVSQGKISSISGPGFHGKKPFLDDTHTISVRTQALDFPNEPVTTFDRQTANMSFSVNYAAIPSDKEIEAIYREYQTLEGLESRILKRQVREAVKSVFGKFTADNVIRERSRLNADISTAIANIGDGLIKIEGVNLEFINFSDAVETAAEERAKAEMSVQTETQKLAKERILADQAIEQARGRAQSALAEAKAKADGQLAAAKATAEGNRLIGEADAYAIKAKSDALSANPNLIEYQKALTWKGEVPTTMVPNTTVPFINMK